MANYILDDAIYQNYKVIHLICSGEQSHLISGDVDLTSNRILSKAAELQVSVIELDAPHLQFPIHRGSSTRDKRFSNLQNHLRVTDAAIGKTCQ